MNRHAPIFVLLGLVLATPSQALEIPPHDTFQDQSGLEVVVVEDHALPNLTLRLAFPVGSLQDPDGKEGVTSLMTSLLEYGTAGLDQQGVASTIEGLGASFGAAADEDTIVISGSIPTLEPTAVARFIELFFDLATRPTLAQSSLEKRRKLLLGRLQAALDNNAGLAQRAIKLWALEGHPYGRTVSGTIESLSALTAEDVRDVYERAVIPAHGYLFVGGDIDAATIKKVLAIHPGVAAWVERSKGVCGKPAKHRCAELCRNGTCVPNRHLSIPPAPHRTKPELLLIDKAEPSLSQEQFRAAFMLARPLGSEGWFPFRLAAHIVGGDFTARLNKVLRVQQGLTYGARLQTSYGKVFPGTAVISTYTKPGDVVKALDLAFAELDDLRAKGPSPDELAAFKAKIVNSRPFIFETVEGVLDQLLFLRLHELPDSLVTGYEQAIEAVTAAQVKEAAQVLDPATARIVVIGNKADAARLGPWVKQRGGTLTIRPAASLIHR